MVTNLSGARGSLRKASAFVARMAKIKKYEREAQEALSEINQADETLRALEIIFMPDADEVAANISPPYDG